MRTAFGKFCEELRVKAKMTQTEFASATGYSLSRISNIESQRTSISDDVIRVYLKTLQCNGEEAHKLRKLAIFSNSVRNFSGKSAKHAPLHAMLQQFGDRISPESILQIQRILERDTGETVETLKFSSNQTKTKKTAKQSRRAATALLSPKRFVEIAVMAHNLRKRICGDLEKLDVGFALQFLSVSENDFDYKVLEHLPSYAEGAFACIVGHSEGNTILVEEKRMLHALHGVHFARHVICHEVAHHILHKDMLESDSEIYFAPQELAKNSCDKVGTSGQIEQVVDQLVEVEAELFATFLIVPWEAFLKGTSITYLANDFGEQQKEVERVSKYFRNPSVLNEMRSYLWANGVRRHPIFNNG